MKIVKNLPQGGFRCQRTVTTPYTTEVLYNMPWDLVGVARLVRLSTGFVNLTVDDIICKAAVCTHVIVSIPWDVTYG